MKTRNVLIICVTALLIAWLKYWTPVFERELERDMQHEILRQLHVRPSIEITPEPEGHRL